MIEGRETRVMRFTGDGTELTQKQHRGGTDHVERVERDFIPIAAHGGAGGYSRIRAGDGAQGSLVNETQGYG